MTARGRLPREERMKACGEDHCLNLAAAVTAILLHRRMQRQMAGLEPLQPSYAALREHRGFADTDDPLRWEG
jgi:hypothetical protein